MFYIGIDHHKNHSYFCCLDEKGRLIKERKIMNAKNEIERFLNDVSPEETFSAVLESGRNWGVMYDTLEETPRIEKVALANPIKTRAIADARIKTDSIDARTLAELLRGNLIPELWIPPHDIRELKQVARYRIYLVREMVKIKNRIHNIVDRNHLEKPKVTDLFGKYGRQWLEKVALPERERILLNKHLNLLNDIKQQIKEMEKWIEQMFQNDDDIKRLKSIPGIGKVFAVIIKLEIGDIRRFSCYKKLHSYSGLIPRTYASGKRIYQGRLIKQANLNLRWAFIEAAVSAVSKSIYFRNHYERIKKNKGTQAGIISTARKLSAIAYKVLKNRYEYQEVINK